MTTPQQAHAALAWFLSAQDDVITRRQVLECGLSTAFLRRKLRRREWVTVFPGVYVTHTGPMTWRQRAWAAVLSIPRAALSHQSALCAAGLRNADGPIHIAVGRKCFAPKRRGVVVHRYNQLDDRVLWYKQPPRVRVEHAVLDAADSAPTDVEAIALMSDAVQARATTAQRLRSTLADRPRSTRRKFLDGVLADVAAGTCSVLEHGYLRRVERAHGLPRPTRQAPTRAGRRGFRDVKYDRWGLVVELDGRFAHDDAKSRDKDMERDLDAAVGEDLRSIRLGWGQVYDRPCTTAVKVGQMLGNLGWPGKPAKCPRCTTTRRSETT